MKTAHEILSDIWQALARKIGESEAGMSKPNEILLMYTGELGQLGECLRYTECLHQLPHKEVHGHIQSFVRATRRAALRQTKDPVQMHRIARDIFFDLGLNSLLTDAKIFFPERTRHLYQILVALDLRIEKCSSGVSSMSPHILAYYEKIAGYFYLLLDSTQHDNISDELAEELTDGFIAALSAAAFEGKANVLQRKNALAIFMYFDLSDLALRFDKRFPERNERGFFIMTGESKEENAA